MAAIEEIARETLGQDMFDRVEIDQSGNNADNGEVWIDVIYDAAISDVTPKQMMTLADRAWEWDGRGDLAPVVSFVAFLDTSSQQPSVTALRWAYVMRRRAHPASASLLLQRRKKAAPNTSKRPLQFSRIERGVTA